MCFFHNFPCHIVGLGYHKAIFEEQSSIFIKREI
jgi:hypothetical protein